MKRTLYALASRIADPTVLFSFSSVGYRLHRHLWDPTDLEVDLSGKICLITGANSGIGFETAKALAERNATVILACRNEERGRGALDAIRQHTDKGRLELDLCDVSELESVRELARKIQGRHRALHVLCCNAGAMLHERVETSDGIEKNLATNVLGHFLLANLLLPTMIETGQARLLHTSSGGMYTQKLKVDDLQATEGDFDGVRVYAQNKRAQVILSEMYAAKLQGTGVTSNCFHPGWADTPAVQTSLPGFHKTMGSLLRSPAQGADTLIWLAVCPSIEGRSGEFWFDREPRRTHVFPGTSITEEEREKLWTRLVDLCGEDVPIAAKSR